MRKPNSIKNVIWRNGQNVLQSDMVDEQDFVKEINAALANNHLGSGLILDCPTSEIIFDSDNLTVDQQSYVVANSFDGRGINPHSQPIDKVLGNQLQITLTGAETTTRKSVKLCIIGLSPFSEIQMETFEFRKNEIKTTKKHFKQVISLLFNDFKGNGNSSISIGGRILITVAQPMQISRDELMASQNLEPNLFFRDFKVADQNIGPNNAVALSETIQQAIGTGYNVDNLNIYTGWIEKKNLSTNDITTRYGQKFQAKSNNIQKVRILLGIEADNGVAEENKFDFSGDIILSIHALQTSVNCPTDTIPENNIDYQPNAAPIVQVVINQSILGQKGITLTDIPQPIDFILSNTKVGGNSNTGIIPENYYIVTIHRTGDASVGDVFTVCGRNISSNSTFTTFDNTWTDDPDKDMWFEVYTDAIKVCDGQGYDLGYPVFIPKVKKDETTGADVDYCLDGIDLANHGQNVINNIIVQSASEKLEIRQDDRTGNNVYSRDISVASVSAITNQQLTALRATTEPVLLGIAYDINNKSSYTVNGTQNYYGLVGSSTFDIIDPDATLKLVNLVGAKFTPDLLDTNIYRIYKATLCNDLYGDFDSDGEITPNDLIRASEILDLIGVNAITSQAAQTMIASNSFTMLELLKCDVNGDGFITGADITLIEKLYKKDTTAVLPNGRTFERLRLYVENFYGRNDGYHSSDIFYARLYNPLPYKVIYSDLSDSQLLYYGNPEPTNIYSNVGAYATIPFVGVNYRVEITPNWFPEFFKVEYSARYIPCVFENQQDNYTECTTTSICSILEPTHIPNAGRNDFFVPNNLIIGKGGIINKDGTSFNIDYECKNITLELPEVQIASKTLDIITAFVVEEPGTGLTSKGYPAMKFSDCSYVQSDCLVKNQVRITVSVGSLSQSIDGNDPSLGYGAIVDSLVGLHITSSGALTITANNILNSAGSEELRCRINITIMVKKAGWKNENMEVNDDRVMQLLGL